MSERLKISSYGSGEQLVFIHGWGINSAVWQPIAEKLSVQYKVITIDLPGFGKNTDIELQSYDLANVVSYVADVITEPSTVIGWSLGGLVASQLTLSYPEKISRLVTLASSPCFVEHESWPGIKGDVLVGFYHMLSKDPGKTIDNFLKIQAMGSPNLRRDVKKIRDLINLHPVPSEQTLANSLTLLENINLKDRLPQIAVPFLRMYGRLDTLVPTSIITLVSELSDNSEIYIFDKASHAPFISHEEEFYLVLTRWLKGKPCE